MDLSETAAVIKASIESEIDGAYKTAAAFRATADVLADSEFMAALRAMPTDLERQRALFSRHP